jgi:hypothetical protein
MKKTFEIKSMYYRRKVILTGTDRPRKYWNDLKSKLKKEGSELSEKIGQLKMQSSDGKFFLEHI